MQQYSLKYKRVVSIQLAYPLGTTCGPPVDVVNYEYLMIQLQTKYTRSVGNIKENKFTVKHISYIQFLKLKLYMLIKQKFYRKKKYNSMQFSMKACFKKVYFAVFLDTSVNNSSNIGVSFFQSSFFREVFNLLNI
jgi:hypothetical protein